MTESTPITVAYGDGIGPEIMEATLDILGQAQAKIQIDTITIGKDVYEKGESTGIPKNAWDSIKRNKIILKAPITTPQGGGYKSLNVTLRKTLGLYANVRPCVSYHPFVKTNFPDLDLTVIRENEEGLYAGIEYRQTHDLYHCLKFVSRSGSERISRYAFEYALQNNRKQVACFSKDNIMKLTDGLFHKVFDEVATEYPSIDTEHYIIDIGSARLAADPERFDVICTTNLYGDIISDIAAEVSGSVGLAGSANIGREYAMFEAIHGSAPDIAGQNIANPSGLLHGAIMMLVHIGQHEVATTIHNALLRTIEDGIHTADIYDPETSKEKVGTQEFAQAVIANFGQKPSTLKAVEYKATEKSDKLAEIPELKQTEDKQLVGTDVFVQLRPEELDDIVQTIQDFTQDTSLKLQIITSRGLKVWPKDSLTPDVGTDYCRCRFAPEGLENKQTNHDEVIALLSKFSEANLDFIKTENLYAFNDNIGFSLAQGE